MCVTGTSALLHGQCSTQPQSATLQSEAGTAAEYSQQAANQQALLQKQCLLQ